jgi:23S rRNA pseudouridine2605 synthase
LLEWAGLEAPKGPLKQRTKREIEKAATAFTPKSRNPVAPREDAKAPITRRQAGGGRQLIADQPVDVPAGRAKAAGAYAPKAEGDRTGPRPVRNKPPTAAKKPSANRRVRQSSDLTPPKQQKRSDRNKGRG